MRRMIVVALLFVVGACLPACATDKATSSSSRTNVSQSDPARAYFKSPKLAVQQITDLLNRRDFKTLAAYYDLSGSGIPRSELESGRFFITDVKPDGARSEGYWRYKQPFSVGFGYAGHRATREKDIFIVDVSVRVDQGPGMPPGVGFDDFPMRRTPRGWALLPKEL